SFISSSDLALSQTTVDGTGQIQVNPEYVSWVRQDQLLASWLLSSLSENLLVMMVGKNTSKEIWQAVESNYSGQSKARLMQFKLQLQTLKKGNLPMREFLSQVKACCDALGTACEPLSEQNHILHILGGLGQEYNAVVVVVTTRIEAYTLNEVHSMLLSLESRMDLQTQPTINLDGSSPSAHYASQNTGNNNKGSTNQGGNQFHNSQSQNPFGRGNNHNNFSTRGRGRNARGRGGRNFRGNFRTPCQLCGLSNHTADRCFHRYDSTYPGPTNLQAQVAQASPPQVVQPTTHYLNQASDTMTESSWFADSGATNHVTNELSNLNLASEFQGTNKLQIGNVTGLSISHIGNSFLKSNLQSKPFLLKNLLHVPSITKNLVSVSQFAKDN
ncbi:Unknown protein, partial [Striga hermonthica]